jgi:hypothetical protein
VYVKFANGRQVPGGYVVPCELVRQVRDTKLNVIGAYVQLTSEDGIHSWQQYADNSQLLEDSEVENEHEC